MQIINTLQKQLQAHGATLVAVSKTHPPERVLELYRDGQRDFGENRVQELVAKYEALPKDIRWHVIGHLQTNKVRDVVAFVHLIHSVDSLKLVREIDRQAARAGRVVDGLLQFHIAAEESKYGLDEAAARALLAELQRAPAPHVRLCGVMGMATFTDNGEQVRAEFRELRRIFEALRRDFFAGAPHFREISMGMSGDWKIALEEGSTMVRIGSLLFGERK
jgi:pyridoxal phosphate enzyme (YggS family)